MLPWLSGCVGLAVAGAGGAGFGQGKTPIDRTISLIEGKTCSYTRYNQGLSYCVEDEAIVPYDGHCFRTLGDVTCYTKARPFPGRQAPLPREPNATAVHQPPAPRGAPEAIKPLAEMPSNMN